MTTEELHEILDYKNKKLNISELQEVIYELKNDCLTEFNNTTTKRDEGFYIGEQNAFQICLDLLEHLQNQSDEISFLKEENERIRQNSVSHEVYKELLDENERLKKRLENSVELPCKVGDTLYTFSCGKTLKCDIDKFTVVFENGNNVLYATLNGVGNEYCGMLHRFITVEISEFGKTVFLTKEEAEKALAERSE